LRYQQYRDTHKKTVTAFKEKSFITIPKAVAEAGGCSMFKATIIKIEKPTASE